MEGCWIKVRAVRPDKRVHLRIQPNLLENGLVTERSVHRPGEHRSKIDFPDQSIAKCQSQTIWANNLKSRDTMESMKHGGSYESGSMGKGSAPACNRSQSALNSD
jgi:hypothetical protein